MLDITAEGEWLVALPSQAKVVFLVTLAWELTIAARSTYDPQSDGLLDPARARRINEIQQRVITCLKQSLSSEGNGSWEPSIAGRVLDVTDSVLLHEISYAWKNARLRAGLSQFLADLPRNPLSDELAITASVVDTQSTMYRFTVANACTAPLTQIWFKLSLVLEAYDFGLDDTHMNLPPDPPVEISRLEPGESVEVFRDRCWPIAHYKGPSTKQIFAKYAVGDDAPVTGHSIDVGIEGESLGHRS